MAAVTICSDFVLVAQSCPILCDPMDCSPSGSSVHGILQAKILQWVAISFSAVILELPLKKVSHCFLFPSLFAMN